MTLLIQNTKENEQIKAECETLDLLTYNDSIEITFQQTEAIKHTLTIKKEELKNHIITIYD